MKKLSTLIAILICFTNLKAQYVTIPDPNFATWLQANVPSAMNGNQMDTTSLAVTTRTIVDIHVMQQQNYYITNLTGIQYFSSLKFLNCNGNYINNLPKLPAPLDSLFCNSITTTTINPLPTGLKKLIISGSNLVSLPTLPTTLKFLSVWSQSLSVLPALPVNLEHLECHSSPGYISHSLPSLPNTLKYLFCSQFKLDSLPTLPNTLIALDCQMNLITHLPTLPNNLEFLNCSYLEINSIPTLPSNLKYLNCIGNNSITSLPVLPSSLTTLACSSNSLTTLPILPNGLKDLTCNNILNLNLPTTLPDSLWNLDCRNNNLTSLPQLPNNLSQLMCSNNQISCFPSFPNSLTYIDIANNPFTCLPNYLQVMDAAYINYPLCLSGFTSNSCQNSKGLAGSVYKDNNMDCNKNLLEQNLTNIPIKLYNSSGVLIQQTNSLITGKFAFNPSAGTYSVVIDTVDKPYAIICNTPGIDSLAILNNTQLLVDSIDFSIVCKPGFDLGIQSITTTGIVFPGQQHTLNINAYDITQWYNLNCLSGVGGSLVFSVNGPVTYIGPAVGSLTPSVLGNVYTYTIADFGAINNVNDFSLLFVTDTTAQAGNEICINAIINPITGDNNPNNNTYYYCYHVVNSLDPNIKEVYPIGVQPGFNDWLTYTIHFQNTGNAPAYNIRLADTLDNMLDLETFQIINYSHPNVIDLIGNILNVRYPNIMLPDSTSNSSGSIGFVQYRIKPKATWAAPYKIKNTAYIYFDYNAPIVTNTTYNSILVPTGLNNQSETLATLYPNPTNGIFTIELHTKEKQSLQVYDMTGNMVLSQSIENGKAIIDASHLATSIYNISIKGTSSITNKKLAIVK